MWIDDVDYADDVSIHAPVRGATQCVRNLLETCADGRSLFSLSVRRNEAEGRDIAYSTCTGRMLAMRPRYKDA